MEKMEVICIANPSHRAKQASPPKEAWSNMRGFGNAP
jgi:hypothetical protein